MGNGYAAIFQYESGVDLTGHGTGDGNDGAGSNGQIFTRARDSFVGVQSPFGSIKLGRLAAFNQWVYDYHLFGDQVGDLGNIWCGKNQPGRFDSAVQYRTPDFAGFAAAVTSDPSGNQGANDSSAAIVKVDYANGGLKVGAAYASYGQGSGTSKLKTSALTASYDFGMVNVGGGWQRESNASTGGNAPFNQDTTYYTLGAGVKLGHGMVKPQYARAANVSATAATDGGRQCALGYDHAWDKDTTL